MTKEEVNIVFDLYDVRAKLMKLMYTADGLMEIYKHDNEDEAAKYQCGKKYAYMDAMGMISELINKIKNQKESTKESHLTHEL